jgi:plastocyanin
VDEMNFAYGVIVIVGLLAAVTLGFIAISPDDIPEPRIVEMTTPKIIEIDEELKTMEPIDDPISCIAQWDPMCGVDGETYGNLCELDVANIKLDYQGECIVPELEAAPEPEATMEMPAPGFADVEEMIVEPTPEPIIEETPEPEALPMTGIVTIPPGAAVPGCENGDECYLPYTISVATGATVMWSNDDSAVHTVSSGTVDGGLTEVFDSGLFMTGESFEFTFDESGAYDYFCMVHPWMTGVVSVS